ncbi:MAG: 4a-hydroxytetrahydrobiopterin dehydratase [Exiguobacterium marinum]|uniref:4a-hydroxytetrahydrobiopterin dehydratase n=1 Tax=Exiguobacterium marinum TaxID=273528 RepID=A0ABY7WZ97_9BACL|nr:MULTISPECIES: 4a-hydroxytetrahydrobiopterin dehydratase [Exiguobacterium]WDH76194.1 4a-hydroxytetrahydrobiopterin dehydratase [Exiguobacterium marinum]
MVLSQSELTDELSRLSGWQEVNGEIQKTYRLETFPEAIQFVHLVADLAESLDHHPNILIEYRDVTLTVSTHDEGGITEKDITLAKGCEGLV